MSWPPAPRVSPSFTAAARALRALVVVQVVVGLAALPVAAYFVIGDLSDHSDDWDGLAAFIGALVGGVALVLVGVGVLVLWLLRRNPVEAGAIVTALGGVLLLTGVHHVVLPSSTSHFPRGTALGKRPDTTGPWYPAPTHSLD